MEPYANALPGMLECLPSRATCDMLYRSFVISIHSIMPLIHLPTVAEQYRRFWIWIDERNVRGPPNGVLAETPSFLPLLFSVLFSGAVTCSSEDLEAHFGLTPRGTISSLLCQAAMRTQNMVAFPRNPTIYSLASFLIVHNLLDREEEPVAACSYVSVALRVAQAMGLHRDGAHFTLDRVETEMRRRIWWHIIHTDIMTAIPSALPPSCLSDSIYDTRMISEMKDACLPELVESPGSEPNNNDRPADLQKIHPPNVDANQFDLRLMVALDRYTITSVLRRILRRQFDTAPLTKADIASLKDEVDTLDSNVRARVAQLRDICERQGVDDTQVDHLDNTVFVGWAALLLQLMVHKAYCVLYQPLIRASGNWMWAQVRHEYVSRARTQL